MEIDKIMQKFAWVTVYKWTHTQKLNEEWHLISKFEMETIEKLNLIKHEKKKIK